MVGLLIRDTIMSIFGLFAKKKSKKPESKWIEIVKGIYVIREEYMRKLWYKLRKAEAKKYRNEFDEYQRTRKDITNDNKINLKG
jgi:hypothetical protein